MRRAVAVKAGAGRGALGQAGRATWATDAAAEEMRHGWEVLHARHWDGRRWVARKEGT